MRFTQVCTLAGAILAASGAMAQDRGQAGDFDYYVMSLSWSPNWCAITGDARGDAQCDDGTGLNFVLHGLWPQYEKGWPQNCATEERDPSRRDSQAMADIMGSGGLAWYQWQKHGRCSGLSAQGYYATARDAYGRVAIPRVFRKLDRNVRLPAAVVEQAFLDANPEMTPDMVTVTCDNGFIQEVRVCLDKTLTPRPCAPDSRRDCTLDRARMDRVR